MVVHLIYLLVGFLVGFLVGVVACALAVIAHEAARIGRPPRKP